MATVGMMEDNSHLLLAFKDSFKIHWRQYCSVQSTENDLALLWLFRPLEHRDINYTYLILTYYD